MFRGQAQPVNAGDTAWRAQRLKVTRSVRAPVALWRRKLVRASTRCTPTRSLRGLTDRTYIEPRLGFVSVRTTLPSSRKTTFWIWRPWTVTRNGEPWQPVLPAIAARPRAQSSPPAGAGPGGGVQTTGAVEQIVPPGAAGPGGGVH